MNAVSNATVTFAGQNYGAKKPARIKKTALEASAMIIVISLVWTLILLTAGQYIARLYTADPVVIQYACDRMKILLPIYFVCGIVEVLVGCMRGMGYSLTPMLANFFCICVFRIVWIYTACKAYPSAQMLYMSWPISWVLNIVVDGIIMIVIYKREKRKIATDVDEYVHFPDEPSATSATDTSANDAAITGDVATDNDATVGKDFAIDSDTVGNDFATAEPRHLPKTPQLPKPHLWQPIPPSPKRPPFSIPLSSKPFMTLSKLPIACNRQRKPKLPTTWNRQKIPQLRTLNNLANKSVEIHAQISKTRL